MRLTLHRSSVKLSYSTVSEHVVHYLATYCGGVYLVTRRSNESTVA